MSAAHLQVWLWAFPITNGLHVFEEFAWPGGLIRWIGTYNPRRLKRPRYYVVLNGAAILGAVLIAAFARNAAGYWLYLYSVALLAGNSLTHLRAAAQQRRYCPGSVTGAVLLVPLAIAGAWNFAAAGLVAAPFAAAGVAAGLAVGVLLFHVDARPLRPNPWASTSSAGTHSATAASRGLAEPADPRTPSSRRTSSSGSAGRTRP